MQDDLVSLGFLADGDRGNADAVADATILLLKNGLIYEKTSMTCSALCTRRSCDLTRPTTPAVTAPCTRSMPSCGF